MTAVEWLINHIDIKSIDNTDKYINQAKEMEKQQRQEDTNYGYSQGYEDGKSGATFFQQLIQSLQQPTEIEVEIDMSNIYAVPEPKIDSEGCLILKRK